MKIKTLSLVPALMLAAGISHSAFAAQGVAFVHGTGQQAMRIMITGQAVLSTRFAKVCQIVVITRSLIVTLISTCGQMRHLAV